MEGLVHNGSPSHAHTSTLQAHAHRLDNSPSKLPAFRFADLNGPPLAVVPSRALLAPDPERPHVSGLIATKQGTTSPQRDRNPSSAVNATTPLSPSSSAQPSFSTSGTAATLMSPSQSDRTPTQTAPRDLPKPHERRLRKAPASHSNRAYGVETFTGPPSALSTQRIRPADQRTQNKPTTEWALAQQTLTAESLKSPQPATANDQPALSKTHYHAASRSQDETASSRPLIPPIRSFRSSTSRTVFEMNGRSMPIGEPVEDQESDRDRTLRALEGYSGEDNANESGAKPTQTDQGSRNAAGEDLFLTLARDGSAQNFQAEDGIPNRTEQRRSRIALASSRQSLPPVSTSFQQLDASQAHNRGADRQSLSSVRPSADGSGNFQPERIPYRQLSRDRTSSSQATPIGAVQRPRYASGVSRSSPMTPRDANGREQIFEPRQSFSGRASSITDQSSGGLLRNASYRQSNLSYSAPRTYNSSSLAGSVADAEYDTQAPKNVEGTESTGSTTAPSTVWDELDDLKSRIRKLELTGKLPATSGAAVSHASGERPPTATTTNTTVSTSPLRGRRLSTSPIDSNGVNTTLRETHPLLQAALAKSKPLLSVEVFRALEAAASDALDLASILGTAGQPGPMSSAQSVIGSSASTVTDRQLRRKADSMCRSLTELCLALSDGGKTPTVSQIFAAPNSREKDFHNGTSDSHRLTSNEGLQVAKSSPRAASRLEARRSSLLASSSLPAPRYAPSDVGTPTQISMTGRRTSMLLRNRRAGTEELEDEEARIRAPSRATTDIGLTRNSQREYSSLEALPDRRPSISSNLPMRRQYNSTNISSASPAQNFTTRRYLERTTPERDTSSVIGRLAEDRGLKGPMVDHSFDGQGLSRGGSLIRRSRQL